MYEIIKHFSKLVQFIISLMLTILIDLHFQFVSEILRNTCAMTCCSDQLENAVQLLHQYCWFSDHNVVGTRGCSILSPAGPHAGCELRNKAQRSSY